VGAEPVEPIPRGWAQPPPELYELAKHKALQVMRIGGLHPAPARLARFYDVAGGMQERVWRNFGRLIPSTSHRATFLRPH
jgi:hypothetical protein